MVTTTWCGNCGTALPPQARFCGACGQPADAGSGSGSERYAAPDQPRGGADDAPTQRLPTQGPASQYPPPDQYPPAGPPGQYPPPGGYAGSPPPSAGPPYASRGSTPIGGTPSGSTPTGGVPWAGQSRSGPGRDGVDALLGGDWAGALLAAGAALASMLVLALVSLLLLDTSDAGPHLVLSATAMLTCAALGGNLFARAEGSLLGASGEGSASVGALPLTLTLVGCTVLAVVFLRRTRGAAARDVLHQVGRTCLVLALLTFLLALVSRVRSTDSDDLFGIDASIGASAVSSLFGALLFGMAALGVALLVARPELLPSRVGALRATTRPALLGAVAVLAVGLLAALGGLVYTLVSEDEQLGQIGLALLALPNVALAAVLLPMGVPLSADVEGLGSTASSGDSITLLTFTEESVWWWLAPVVLALTLVAVAVALVVRQNTLPAARREALRFAGCLAATAFVAALLLRTGADGGGGVVDRSITGQVSVTFNPLLAALIAGLWGLAAGVVAPQLATVAGAGVVHAVRQRFGVAADPPPYAASPGPEHGQPDHRQPDYSQPDHSQPDHGYYRQQAPDPREDEERGPAPPTAPYG